MITIKDFEQFQPQASNHQQKNIIKQQKYEFWESQYYKSILKKFKIVLTKDNEIQYFVDGQLQKIKEEKSYDIELEGWNNLEQIQNLEWLGSYGQKNQKVGKWKATWIGETLHNVVNGTQMMEKIRIMEGTDKQLSILRYLHESISLRIWRIFQRLKVKQLGLFIIIKKDWWWKIQFERLKEWQMD
ncbi:unnamed protein product [Paramecium pentaurelia]|uniref:Uncharacterized protein n=1 Tax=Paramecium pentaurelia TaxID=43138 RepID=A0A8S1YJU4_9CILI|nr:unnamed protein product [Paramecium pentaurelia]